MVMPDGMTGRQLVEKVRATRKLTKAIYVSGYSSEFCDKENVLEEGVNFMQKPYHPQALGEAIRRCLDHAPLDGCSTN